VLICSGEGRSSRLVVRVEAFGDILLVVLDTETGGPSCRDYWFESTRIAAIFAARMLFGGEENVVGGVGDAQLLIGVGGVAARCGSLAAFGAEALDEAGAGEDAGAFVADHTDEEPRNGIGVGRGRVRSGFAGDAATVAGFPGGTSEMLAERFAVLIEKLSVGSFQGPGELGGIAFAGIDLVALGMDLENKLGIGGGLQPGGKLLGQGDNGQKQYKRG
jgi:hypothetical protein